MRVQYLGLDRLGPPAAQLPAAQPVVVAAVSPDVPLKPRWTKPSNGTVVLPPAKPIRAAASVGPPETPKQETASATSRRLLVEAAVLDGRDDADRLGDQVRALGAVAVEPERRNGRVVYAVRIGPVDTDDEAALILAELNRAGFTGSHIVAAGYR